MSSGSLVLVDQAAQDRFSADLADAEVPCNDAGRMARARTGTPALCRRGHPWRCRQLVVGTGADGALPVMQPVRDEARRRKVDLVVLPTAEAIGALTKATADTNAILHLTC
jgi:hypothetical protein